LTRDEINDTKVIGFGLIFDGIQHRELRKIDQILADEKTREEFWKALDYSKSESLAKKTQVKKDAEDKDELTPLREIFADCLDSVKARDQKNQPVKLLDRALKNLATIEMKKSSFTSPQSITLIQDIEQVVRKLKALAGGARK